MGQKWEDIWLAQSSTGLTVDDDTYFMRKGASGNDFGISKGSDITAYLDIQGYLNESILPNPGTVIANIGGTVLEYEISNFTKPSRSYFGGGFVTKSGNSEITTDTYISCIDDTGAVQMDIVSGFIKELSAAWAVGSGVAKGALDTGSLNIFKLYSIYIIAKADGTSDILCVEGGNTPTMPTDYVYKREIARIHVDRGSKISKIYNYYQIQDTPDLGTKHILPFDYFEGFGIEKLTSDSITFAEGNCKDNTNEYDLIYRDIGLKIGKEFDAAWAAGESNGMLDTGAIADDTQYYLYIIQNLTTGAIDFLMSLSATSPTMPAGFTIKKLIGFLNILSGYILSPDPDLYIIWGITDKWEDQNFDVSSIAKDASIVTEAPTYEALFSGDSNTIKVATFDSSGAQAHYIDGGVEYPHGAKDDMPIHFHAHCYSETANAGNVVLFLDYIITDEGDIGAAAAPTRITVTAAAPGAVGEHFTVSLPWIFPTNLEEGSQIWFTFGRLSTDAADTYADKIAIRTFGFHYLTDKRGSDMETSDL